VRFGCGDGAYIHNLLFIDINVLFCVDFGYIFWSLYPMQQRNSRTAILSISCLNFCFWASSEKGQAYIRFL